MRIHYLQHVPFEGLGHIAQWAGRHGHTVTRTALYDGEALPEPAAFDFLVVMGGPMGVHDTSQYDWMTREKQFIEQALKQAKRVLGICLGAQFIADVLGARVFANTEKEIGWHPVTRSQAAEESAWADTLPAQFHAFHWHGDTFDLPAGALHLARSAACRHQAFFYPPGVVGLQFHLESTTESIDALIDNCGHELVPASFIQSAGDIRNGSGLVPASNALMDAILDHLAGCGGGV